MKKISISVFVLFIFSFTCFAQGYFFYHDKDKMALTRNYEYLTVKFKQNAPVNELDRVYSNVSAYAQEKLVFNDNSLTGRTNSVLIIKLNQNINSDVVNVLELGIRNSAFVENVGMCFRYNDKVLHFSTNEVIVKFKKGTSRTAVDNLNALFKTTIIQQVELFDNTYLVSLNSNNTDNVFETANRYSLTQFVEFSQPNFIRTGMLLSEQSSVLTPIVPNDTLIPRMWHVKNTGSNIPDNVPGIPGCDMNLERAWEITTGNPRVLIAIIDTGVDTNHTDLRQNLCDRSLWYDAYDNDQKPFDEHYHGTGVSGTSSAVGNNIMGTAGVAFNCRILPVRVFGPSPTVFTTDLILAKGLNWAWMHGASVMNCSWGGGIPTPLITHAIRNAVHFGRNGKGAVVFGGAGNADTNVVIYPASMPEVIGVGGLSPCNQRKSPQSCDNIGGVQNWGACFGEGMEIVAPTTYIGTTQWSGGWCICGNGTSVSSPLAAGVGALMISKNVNLSGDSVKLIIEKYAVKVGSYSYNVHKENGMWNNEMGYGKIDARVCLDHVPAGPVTVYEQVPPVIKIYPPESRVFGLPISVDADIYDISSGLATGENGPRLYYMFENTGIMQVVKGLPIAAYKHRYTFFIPTPPNVGLFYYIAAQDISPVPNFVTYPQGGYGIDPPGLTPPGKMMYVKNTATSQELFTSTDVPITIPSDRETMFVSLLDVPINATILDIRCQVNLTHTFDADLTLSLISPAGTEIVLAGGVGWDGDNFENTVFTDEAGISIDSSDAQPPYQDIYRPIEKLWLFDGENSAGEWKLKVTDNGFADGGELLGWNITITYPEGTDNITLPKNFSLTGNYPNPFNPNTRILFNVPKTSHVKIVIYDVSGREVKTLLNETRQPGFEHFVDFDASGFASGVYFYSLIANGEFIESKKMIMVK